jgi:hypothetical protein
LTHALADQATLPPLGSAAGADAPAADRCCPLLSASAPLAAPNGPAAYAGEATVAPNAETPSALLPERAKAVSLGAPAGRQPANADTKAAPAAQLAHAPEPSYE